MTERDPELARALAQIHDIRAHVAAGALFRGLGPAVVAATGALALTLAAAQTLWPALFAETAPRFYGLWIAVAILCALLMGAEMVARSRRLHGGFADAMLLGAAEQFLPATVAGAALAVALLGFAPDAAWMLPGLWQILVALGLFAALRTLPRALVAVAAWYFLSGFATLLWLNQTRALGAPPLEPWAMGLPFGLGQLGMALLLLRAEADAA